MCLFQSSKTAGGRAAKSAAERKRPEAAAAAAAAAEEEDPDDPMQEGVLYEVSTQASETEARRVESSAEWLRRIADACGVCRRWRRSSESVACRIDWSTRCSGTDSLVRRGSLQPIWCTASRSSTDSTLTPQRRRRRPAASADRTGASPLPRIARRRRSPQKPLRRRRPRRQPKEREAPPLPLVLCLVTSVSARKPRTTNQSVNRQPACTHATLTEPNRSTRSSERRRTGENLVHTPGSFRAAVCWCRSECGARASSGGAAQQATDRRRRRRNASKGRRQRGGVCGRRGCGESNGRKTPRERTSCARLPHLCCGWFVCCSGRLRASWARRKR